MWALKFTLIHFKRIHSVRDYYGQRTVRGTRLSSSDWFCLVARSDYIHNCFPVSGLLLHLSMLIITSTVVMFSFLIISQPAEITTHFRWAGGVLFYSKISQSRKRFIYFKYAVSRGNVSRGVCSRTVTHWKSVHSDLLLSRCLQRLENAATLPEEAGWWFWLKPNASRLLQTKDIALDVLQWYRTINPANELHSYLLIIFASRHSCPPTPLFPAALWKISSIDHQTTAAHLHC